MAQPATMADRAERPDPGSLIGEESEHDGVGVQPPRDALAAFVHAVASARYAPPRLPSWWHAHAMQLKPGRCCHCGKAVQDAPMLDPIIPIVAGGPHNPHVVVLCCKECKGSRGRKDLLAWKPDAAPTLKALRAQMALEAWNHVTRNPAEMKTKAKAEAVLKRRWSQPRFCCHAALIEEGGFIGWRDTALVPSPVQLRLVFEHRAGRLRPAMRHAHRRHIDSAIFWVPTPQAALDAMWDMIEHNALVRPVDLGAPSADAEGAIDPSDDWKLVLPTTADLVRRRWRRQR